MKYLDRFPDFSVYYESQKTMIRVKVKCYQKYWPIIAELCSRFNGRKIEEFRGMLYYALPGDVLLSCNQYIERIK